MIHQAILLFSVAISLGTNHQQLPASLKPAILRAAIPAVLNRTIGRSHPCATARPGRAFGGATNPGLPYDKENRPLSTTRDSQLQETRVLDENGNVTRLTDANGNTTVFKFDELNRQTEINAPLQSTTTMSYSPAGDVLTMRDPESRLTQMSYDIRRRKVSETNGANEITRFSYDLVNNLRSRSNPKEIAAPTNLGNTCERPVGSISTIVFCYDAANRLTDVIDAENNRTRYAYDLASNRISTTDAKGNVTTMGYDARNRVRTMTAQPLSANQGAPLTSVKTMAYDGNDNVISETTPNGAAITHTYDALNRKTQINFASAPSGAVSERRISYDPNGNVLTETDALNDAGNPTLVARYTYDSRDRRISDDDPLSGIQRSAFDSVGNRISFTDSANNIQAFSYDAKNRGTSAGLGAGQLSITFDKSDLRSSQRSNDGTDSTFVYDVAKRITLIDHSRASATVARVGYLYDQNSNRIEQKETNGAAEETTTYQFDQSDRLTRINYPEKRVDYTLDAIGNRTLETERNLTGTITKATTGTFNARNQLIQLEVRDQSNALIRSTTFSYDANGNQTTEQTVGQPPITTVYDVENRVLTLTTQGAPPTNYRYHPNGLRIEKTNANEARRYRFDQGKLVEERNVQNALLKRYFRSSAGTWIGQLAAGSQPVIQTALLDVSASPMAMVSTAGTVTARIQLDAWGQIRQQSGSAPGIQFQGYLRDAESPNLFAFARRYSSATGTFLSADPVAGDERLPVAQNLYLGFHGNPTIYLDPDGRTEQLRQLVNNFGELHEASYQRMDGLKAEFGRTQNPAMKYFIGTAIGREFLLNLGLMVGEGVTLGADVISDAGLYGLSEYTGLETGTTYSNNAMADLSDAIGKTGNAIGNAPGAVASSLGSGYVEQVSRAVFDNDSRAQAQLLPDVIDLVKRPLKALDGAVARSVFAKTEQKVLSESGDGIGGVARSPIGDLESSYIYSNIEARTLQGPHKGVVLVRENTAKSGAAGEFESGTSGAMSEADSRARVVPALRFDNPNPKGANFVRFDGFEDGGKTLVDRKLQITTKSKQLRDLRRASEAVRQNSGIRIVYEFPSEKAAETAKRILRDRNISGITIRVSE